MGKTKWWHTGEGKQAAGKSRPQRLKGPTEVMGQRAEEKSKRTEK